MSFKVLNFSWNCKYKTNNDDSGGGGGSAAADFVKMHISAIFS